MIAKHHLEPLIAEAIALRLDSPEFRAALEAHGRNGRSAVDLGQLRSDEAALEEAARAYFVERAISKLEYTAVRADLERRIDAARRRLESAGTASMAGRVAGIDVRAEWDGRSVQWRNEVAGTLIDRITVNPAPRRGTRFDPSRVDVEWAA